MRQVELVGIVLFLAIGCVLAAVEGAEGEGSLINNYTSNDGAAADFGVFTSVATNRVGLVLIMLGHVCNRLGVYVYQESCALAPLVIVASIANMFPLVRNQRCTA